MELMPATIADCTALHRMQQIAFADLLARYEDYDTNPACEMPEHIAARITAPGSVFYRIVAGGETVGAIRVVVRPDGWKRISPLFILPEHGGRGYAQSAMRAAEAIHGSSQWHLETIAEEAGNCHLYEKMGYRRAGEGRRINDRMTLVAYEKA